MTIRYDLIEPGLVALLTDLMTTDSVPTPEVDRVIWENAEREHAVRSFIVLGWRSAVTSGVPFSSMSRDTGDVDSTFVETLHTNYVLSLQVYCESFSQMPDEHAMLFMSRLSERLRWVEARISLTALGLALVDISDVQRTDYNLQERDISRAGCDVRFNYASNETNDRATGAVEYIEHVELTSDFQGVDGLPLDSDLQLTEELVP